MAPPPTPSRVARLWSSLPDQLDVVIEQARGTFVRRDEQGRVSYVSPLPLLFAYGYCLSHDAEDGSGLDVIVFSRARFAPGDQICARPLAVADFQDGADWDPKVIARAGSGRATLSGPERLLMHYGMRCLAAIKASRCLARTRASETAFFGLWPPA